MAHAPLWVTKLLAPAFKMLRMLGVRVAGYIDGILVVASSPHEAAAHMALALHILQFHLNLEVKPSKCILLPSRTFTALGIIWDSTKMRCSIPIKRIISMNRIATRLFNASSTGSPICVRDLGRLVGSLVSARDAIDCYKRRLMHIHQALSKAIRTVGWDGSLLLSQAARSSLEWLTGKGLFRNNGRDILPPPRPITIHMGSDAAKLWGWGAWLRHGSTHIQTRGFFTLSERTLSINNLELLSIIYGICSLLPLVLLRSEWHKVQIRFANDNVSAVYYAMNAIGRSTPMSLEGARLYDFLTNHRLRLLCHWISGASNIEAGILSRKRWSHLDWRLHRQTFHALTRLFSISPQVDLVASRANAQTPKYFSYDIEHTALGTGALTHSWRRLGTLYCFPPPILIGRVLQKLEEEEIHSVLLVTPNWTTQPWLPHLVAAAVELPQFLPCSRHLTFNPNGDPDFHQKWWLIGWHLSFSTPRKQAPPRRRRAARGCSSSTDIQRLMTRLGQHLPAGGSPTRPPLDLPTSIHLQLPRLF